MTISARNAGVFSEAQPNVRTSGAWQALTEAYVRVSGAWVQFYTAFFISISNMTFTYFGGTPAEYVISNDGNVYRRTGSTRTNMGPWISNASLAGQYEARVTVTSGSFQAGSEPADVLLNLGTARVWSRGAGGGGIQSVSFNVEIRRVSDGLIMDTAAITMTCDRT